MVFYNKNNFTPRNRRAPKDDVELSIDELVDMIIDDEDDNDISLGHNKDANDYMGDITPLRMAELDKKAEREQLRVLKTEYQRILDKAKHLNNLYQESETHSKEADRRIADIEKEMKKLKTIIRHFSENFLGENDLKEVTATGSWTASQAVELVKEAIKKATIRASNIDDEVEEAVEEAVQEKEAEIYALKETIEKKDQYLDKFRTAVSKVGEINKELMRLKEFEKGVLAAQAMNAQAVAPVKEQVAAPIEEAKPEVAVIEEPVEIKITIPTPPAKKEAPAPVQKQEKAKPAVDEEPFVLSFQKDLIKPTVEVKEEKVFEPFFGDVFNQGSKKIKKEKISDLFDSNINQYLSSLTENQKVVLRLIGETGVSRYEELITLAEEDKEASKIYFPNGKMSKEELKNTLGKDLGAVRENGFLEAMEVKLNEKGNQKYSLFKLTNVGKQGYKKTFKEDPAYTEVDSLIEEYGSLQKAFVLRDMDAHFLSKGFVKKQAASPADVVYENGTETLPVMIYLHNGDENEMVNRYTEYTKVYGSSVYVVYPTEELRKKEGKSIIGKWLASFGRDKAIALGFKEKGTSVAQIKKDNKNLWSGMDLSAVR